MHLSRQALIFCFFVAAPAFAHHGGGVEYFMDQTRGPVTGTVTAFVFTFPHPYIEFEAKSAAGAMEKWTAVFQPTPTNLRAAGWTRNSVKRGDTVTVSGPPHRSASTVIFARRVEINGKLLEQGGGGN